MGLIQQGMHALFDPVRSVSNAYGDGDLGLRQSHHLEQLQQAPTPFLGGETAELCHDAFTGLTVEHHGMERT